MSLKLVECVLVYLCVQNFIYPLYHLSILLKFVIELDKAIFKLGQLRHDLVIQLLHLGVAAVVAQVIFDLKYL